MSQTKGSRPWLMVGWVMLGAFNVFFMAIYIFQRLLGYTQTSLGMAMLKLFPLGMCIAAVCFIRERLKTGSMVHLIGVVCSIASFAGWITWALLMSSHKVHVPSLP